jgi:ATP-dependent DNA ligase
VLCEEIAHSIRAMSAVLDGEIRLPRADGRSKSYTLLFRRDWPHFVAVDLLPVEGEDRHDRPPLERKRRLRAIMPRSTHGCCSRPLEHR